MAKTSFDYQGAREAGYSDDEIISHLQEKHPKFDYQSAVQSGYSPEEIIDHLSSYKPTQSKVKKAARIGAQYGLGLAESALFPVEASVAIQTSKPALQYEQRKRIGEDLEYLLESNTGVPKEQWPKKDRDLYDYLQEQIQPGGELKDQVEPKVTGIRSLAEKVTGSDLHPEGVLEKSANWAGFLKNPSTLLNLRAIGLAPKELTKALFPRGTEVARGIGAGAALELAEQGEYGPMGTMIAAVAGDLLGGGTAKVVKGATKLAISPKKTLAEVASKFTPKDKVELQKELIKDFRDSGLNADIGTLTDSNLIKGIQSRLAQSHLTGGELDKLKKQLTNQIQEEYQALSQGLGEAKFSTLHEAGEAAREGLKTIREADLAATREFYKNATKSLKENAFVNTEKLVKAIEKLEKELKPGRVKSTEQTAVLNTLEKLRTDITDTAGSNIGANVKDLMNNKIGINDIINYEVQGGAKQLLKGIVAELDRAIISHGKDNPTFARNYVLANKKFSQHAKTFRNKEMNAMLNVSDPAQLMNRMNTVQGIRTLGNVLSKTPEGKRIFDSLKRTKLDKTIGDNMVDSTTQQIKMGTFAKLLEKGKNREVIQEVLGKEGFKRLERLQKNVNKLAETAQKFFNASKSGTTVIDTAIIGKVLNDIAHILYGNPWPILKTAAGASGMRYLTKLMADPEFLRLTEEAIKASSKNDLSLLMQIGKSLMEMIEEAMLPAALSQLQSMQSS